MTTTPTDVHQLAHEVFGWEELRPSQAEAAEAAVSGQDVLAVMPTGYGKSAVYQLAALMVDGPCVVVSPLIALQADQRDGLNELAGKAPTHAVAINSSVSAREQENAWQALEDGTAKFVFLTPEQLAKDEVLDRLAENGTGFADVLDLAPLKQRDEEELPSGELRVTAAKARSGRVVSSPRAALERPVSARIRARICSASSSRSRNTGAKRCGTVPNAVAVPTRCFGRR